MAFGEKQKPINNPNQSPRVNPTGEVSTHERISSLLNNRRRLEKFDKRENIGLRDKVREIDTLSKNDDINTFTKYERLSILLQEIEEIINNEIQKQDSIDDLINYLEIKDLFSDSFYLSQIIGFLKGQRINPDATKKAEILSKIKKILKGGISKNEERELDIIMGNQEARDTKDKTTAEIENETKERTEQEVRSEIEEDQNKRKSHIAAAELSDTSMFGASVSDLFERTKGMTEAEIVSQIESTDISGWIADGVLDKDTMDNYLEDLLNNSELTSEEKVELKKLIDEFKGKEKGLYQRLEKGVIDFGNLNKQLDKIANDLLNQEDKSPFEFSFKGEKVSFNNRREALLTVYQIKLHLDEMDPGEFIAMLGATIGNKWVTIPAALLGGYIAAKLLIFYIKEKVDFGHDGLKEGMRKQLKDSFTNLDGDGSIDKVIELYKKNGFSEHQISSLIKLQKTIGGITIDWSSQTQALDATSRSYRAFANFRGVIGFMGSSLYQMNDKKLERRNKKGVAKEPGVFGKILDITVGYSNKGPRSSFWGWQFRKHQTEIFKSYTDEFSRFHTMVDELDTIMKDNGVADGDRKASVKKILGLYISSGGKVKPFTDKHVEIKKILSDRGITISSADEGILKRLLKGEVNPEIEKKIGKLEAFFEKHPDISDADENRLKGKLLWFRHIEKDGDFSTAVSDEVKKLKIAGISSLSDTINFKFTDGHYLSKDDLNMLNKKAGANLSIDLKVKTEISKYLKSTTVGHKGIVYTNILRIMGGDAPLDKLSLVKCEMWGGMLNLDLDSIVDNIFGDKTKLNPLTFGGKKPAPAATTPASKPVPAAKAASTPTTAPTPKATPASKPAPAATTPSFSIERLTEESDRIRKFLDRVGVEVIIQHTGTDAELKTKLKKLDTEYRKSGTESGIKQILAKGGLEEQYKKQFGITKVRAKATLASIVRSSKFKGSFSDLTKQISGTIDISTLGEIRSNLGKITR